MWKNAFNLYVQSIHKFYFDLCDNSKREIVAETVDNRYFSRYNRDITNDNELCGKRYRDFSIQLLPKMRAKGEIHFSPFALFCITFSQKAFGSLRKNAKRAVKSRNDVLRRAVPERFQVLGDSLNETGARVSRRPRDVRRDDTVLGGEQRVILFRRLVHKNVKPRSGDAATIQRLGKGSFVHNCAARRIDKERSGLHQVKALRIHKPAGLVRERAMQRDDIGIFEKRVELRPLITLGQLPFRAAVYENFHAERRAELCDGLPDMSEADDAERFAVQLKQRVRAVAHRFGLIPVAAAGGGAYFFGVIAQLQNAAQTPAARRSPRNKAAHCTR